MCDRYIFTAFARDVVRGCPPEWVRGIYNFAALPDLTFFFKADLEVSLNRILDGRPKLKFFEAGMDLRLSTDPYESFRIFQGRILEQYLAMSTEFNFVVIDANQRVEAQQAHRAPAGEPAHRSGPVQTPESAAAAAAGPAKQDVRWNPRTSRWNENQESRTTLSFRGPAAGAFTATASRAFNRRNWSAN